MTPIGSPCRPSALLSSPHAAATTFESKADPATTLMLLHGMWSVTASQCAPAKDILLTVLRHTPP